MSAYRYRPEIDGLRALSVAGVVIYHSGLGIPGGFVGVDVFFVISGFLITSLILKESESNTFRLDDFFARRIRRILPASLAVTLATLLIGFLILTPDGYSNLALSSIANSLLVANIFFWRDSGYFSEISELKPLLHTWSLAVEEQFYLIYPLVLLPLLRKGKNVIAWMVVCAFLSLVLSVFMLHYMRSGAFYLLPPRAWELLTGGIIALLCQRKTFEIRYAEPLSIIGLLMILGSMFLLNDKVPFPGPSAMPAIAGACLFIISNNNSLTISGRLLSLRPIVFVGLISYSLYLWHWPLLVYMKHIVAEINHYHTLFYYFIVILISILSWKYIERPFRGKGILVGKKAYIMAACSCGFFLTASGAIYFWGGLPGRFPSDISSIAADMDWSLPDKHSNSNNVPIPIGRLPEPNSSYDFFLWGDSHGAMMMNTIGSAAKDSGLSGAAFVRGGQVPLSGVWLQGDSYEDRIERLARSESILNWIIDNNIRDLVLVGRWSVYLEGMNPVEAINYPRSDSNQALISNRDAKSSLRVTRTVARESLQEELERMIVRLRHNGIKIWLVEQVPELNIFSPAKRFYMWKRYPLLNDAPVCNITISQHEERQRNANTIFDSVNSDDIYRIDPAPLFFVENERVKIYGNRSYWWDDDHLTDHGATIMVKPLLLDMFDHMKRATLISDR
jgi:peptidoglycan/LPS O-acetylase OafA/YrhL